MPMSNKTAMECADNLMRRLMGNSNPFGGKMLLGVGDFRQVAPVVKGAGSAATLDASIRSSPLWHSFQILRLWDPVRNASDPTYADWVDDIGDGVRVGDSVELELINAVTDLETCAEYLFPKTTFCSEPPESLARRSFLSPLNVNVDEFNETMLDRLDGHGANESTCLQTHKFP